MKKSLVISVFVSILLVNFLIAQDQLALAASSSSDSPGVGILPDSPFYFFKTLGEKIRGLFIFSGPARLRYQWELAERRFKEAQALLDRGKGDLATKTIERYQTISRQVDQQIDETIAKGKDAGDVPTVVQEARSKHIQTLERVLTQAPEIAKDTIQRVLEEERLKVVVVEPAPPPIATGGCLVSGCNAEICLDEAVMTICEWKEEYACYRSARCERQSDGKCGWTMTETLSSCLAEARKKPSPPPLPVVLVSPKPGAPQILSIVPSSGPVGTKIRINGSRFTREGNSAHFGEGFAYINNLDSQGDKTIEFTLPESFDTCNPAGTICAGFLGKVLPGPHAVTVINANGTSNSLIFTVTSQSPAASPNPSPSPSPNPSPFSLTVEADDNGLYPATVTVSKNATVRLTFKVRSTNVYFGGLDF